MTDGSAAPAFEEFLELWSALITESGKAGTVILVEGDRDRVSLRALGIHGPILLIHRGVRLGTLAHDLTRASRRAIVLTDWDATGGQLAQRLRDFLAPGPVVVDLEFRLGASRACCAGSSCTSKVSTVGPTERRAIGGAPRSIPPGRESGDRPVRE